MVEAMKELHESEKTMTSREVWVIVNGRIEGSVSRASIINFLNAMVDENLISGTTRTGKGGHRGVYGAYYTFEGFITELRTRVINHANQELGG